MELRSQRSYDFGAAPGAVFDAAGRLEDYGTWWPWLRLVSAERLATGDVWACELRPPIPYVLHLSLAFERVEVPRMVAVAVTGDLAGTSVAEVGPAEGGSRVTVTSVLRPTHPVLAALAWAGRPMARTALAWVLDTGARQFAAVALAADRG